MALVLAARGLAGQHDMAAMGGGWGTTLHGAATLQYIKVFGTRANHQLTSLNWAMFEAHRPGAGGSVRLRVMGSAEPLTVPDPGYPQLLQDAFTDHGATITDRMHPNHWLMEVSARYERAGLSLYVAPIGAPALGPEAYMHRPSAMLDPVAPLAHHAQDGTHSSFGVVTFGVASGRLRLEGSAFNDRQPDVSDAVFYYKGARLDSYSGRVTVTPSPEWSLSASYGYIAPSGGAHAHDAEHRVGAVATFERRALALTMAYGADDPVGGEGLRHTLLVEGTAGSLFARVEYLRRTAEDLGLVGSVSPNQDLGSASVGYGRVLGSRSGWTLRFVARGNVAFISRELVTFYGHLPLGVQAYLHVTPAGH